MQDEQSLITRAQSRDPEAFGQLYEAYFEKIYRYVAIKIGNRTEAEDLTQQVFVNALESICSYKMREVPFSAWLYRIAHNQVVDTLRKRSRRPTMELDESLAIPADGDLVEETELKLETKELVEAAKKLTKLQQEVIALRFGADMPIAQVAKVMGKNEGAIKALQHSAVGALRRIMGESK
ncbi:RNA polymerase sigma-70 factor, ECF subfamily [Dehalogenimonas formicexedens]|uniref:RNA polymerase sigma factor n=1 Tax=Dehalogenimonas formicexedens TaxID=1839801 RepID=A0A1P8F830_9CHLR|nr:sigma-70 family RNA polymerase sigma factor [Dehalogenimonas formicexedens]APV44634.1 RNA polymerase sigma-70 factor, ECF subfamily [Dehalogenimonas formicexedens]